MSKIVDRIQKLLALSKNAGSEAEAALAVERARELMQTHNIAEAELRVNIPSDVRSVEEIIEGRVTNTRKKVAWHMQIAGAVDALYGCHAFWWGGEIYFFGRISAVQAATYTTQYLMREVEAMTDKQAPTRGYDRKYRNGFRMGCARRIRSNIERQLEAREERACADKPAPEVFEELFPAKQPKASDGALAVIKRDQDEVDEAYQDFLHPRLKNGKRRKGRSSNVGNYSSSDGYHAGREAGKAIKINTSRGGLPRGQDSLK